MGINQMEVNAAIEQLIAGTDTWEVCARTVINNCHTLKKDGPLVIETSSTRKSDGDSITGHAAGIGNVTIHDNSKPESKEFSFGRKRERIGYFKVWKDASDELGIVNWWKADIGTRAPDDEDLDVYFLGFDEKTLDPKYFGVERKRVLLTFFGISFHRRYLELIYGNLLRRGRGIGFDITSED